MCGMKCDRRETVIIYTGIQPSKIVDLLACCEIADSRPGRRQNERALTFEGPRAHVGRLSTSSKTTTVDWTGHTHRSLLKNPPPLPSPRSAAARGEIIIIAGGKSSSAGAKSKSKPHHHHHRQLPRAAPAPEHKGERPERKAKSIHSTPYAAAVPVPPLFPRAWAPNRQRRDERACPRGGGSSSSCCVPHIFAGDGAARASGLPLRSSPR